MIGDEVEIALVDIRDDKIRLSITAPKSVPVHRKEVYEAIKRANQAAAGMQPEDVPGRGDADADGANTGPLD